MTKCKRGYVCFASELPLADVLYLSTKSLPLPLSRHRRELGYLHAPPEPLLKATTEEMYSHVQAQHPESLEVAERDWKMELFGMSS